MQLTGRRRGNCDASGILRSLVTVLFALEQTGMDLARFAKLHASVTQHEDCSLIYQWARGETAMKITSALRLDRVAPGTEAIYEHPSFELLRDAPISKGRVTLMLQRYAHPPLLNWWFGDEGDCGVVAGPLRRDSSILVQRGDLDGFAVILGLMCEAEARDHLEDHIRHAAKGARQKADVEHVVARQLACDPFADSGRALRNSPASVAAPSEDTSLHRTEGSC
jgi:hypothetical protein